MRRLVRVAVAILDWRGAGDETPDDWYGDLCRCLHQRGAHYPGCMKCRCEGFRLKVRLR